MSRERIAEALKTKRKESKLSIDEVCKQLKEYNIILSKNTMYNYETGYRQPDADTLMALCEIYGIVNVLETFGYKKSPDTTEAAPEDEAISLEESNKLLVALGYITEGEELSDADLAFLTHVIGLLDAWFDQRHQGTINQSGMPA